jgi:FKBP-type peptidyl-prolyl cis-trans isomerase SlyD
VNDQFVGPSKVVSFTYSIQDEAGDMLEQSDIPISYVHGGKHDLFPKVEAAMEGCVVGDIVQVSLAPEEGFGPHNENLTYTDEIENVPPEFRRLGAEFEMMNDRGDARKFVVTRIENGKLTVDGNHPMAGKIIIFNIKVVDIRDASEEEIRNGVPPMAMPVLH